MTRHLGNLPDKVGYSQGWLYLLEAYETEYGIFNHDTTQDPLAIFYMHEAENPVTHSRLQRRMTEYLEKDVLKYFGLNLSEFLSLPIYVVDEVIAACDRKQKKEHDDERKRLQELEEHQRRNS